MMAQQQGCARVVVYGMAVYLSAYQLREDKMVFKICVCSLIIHSSSVSVHYHPAGINCISKHSLEQFLGRACTLVHRPVQGMTE